MAKSIIRLQKIRIQNLKNVGLGTIRFTCNMWEDIFEKRADVLGVYGQNGSGKTTLIYALSLLKGLMSGTALPINFSNMIRCGEQAAVCSFEFSVIANDGEKYRVIYEVTFTKDEKIELENEASTEENGQIERCVMIGNEKLSIAHYEEGRYERAKIVKATPSGIVPAEYFGEMKKSYGKKKVVDELEKAYKNGISYLFTKELITEEIQGNLIYEIIKQLQYYAMYQLHIISNVQSGVINANIALPFSFVLEEKKTVSMLHGSLKLNGTSVLPLEFAPMIQHKIEVVNIVLAELVPGLNIRLEKMKEPVEIDGEASVEMQLIAKRGEHEIPLQYESDGIKKLISILYVMILAYHDASITAAIDELDSGIFEYLLGELLHIFEESGKGQLIFTSHNLRPLEVLQKKNILFTTTNENNRYLRFQNVKASQNLRDSYFHDIILGGQKECIYEMTNPYIIKRAFRMAGVDDAK